MPALGSIVNPSRPETIAETQRRVPKRLNRLCAATPPGLRFVTKIPRIHA
jgi:hypothetical protein